MPIKNFYESKFKVNYLKETLDWFKNLRKKQKIILSSALLFIMIVSTGLFFLLLTPDYAVLFNQLDEQDANRIVSQLDAERVAYKVQNDGKEILIDKQLIPKERLKIIGSDKPLSGQIGFELFDKSDFGMTDFSQKINYQRALQGELERSISSFDEIRKARVHLMIPERQYFEKQQNKARAAVTLELIKKLSPQQVGSIQKLVAATVSGLDPDAVIVVDQNGNTLSNTEQAPEAAHFSAKKALENYLHQKVMQILVPLFPHNLARVNIDVSLNFNELQRELITPQNRSVIKHEKLINQPNTASKNKERKNQVVSQEKTYEFGSQKQRFKRAQGRIDKLSVSVLLPENTSKTTIAKVERLVKTSIGFTPERGDSISVEALLVEKPLSKEIPPPPLLQQNEVRHGYESRMLILSLVLVLSVLLPVAYMKRRIRHQKRQALLLELTQWLSEHE